MSTDKEREVALKLKNSAQYSNFALYQLVNLVFKTPVESIKSNNVVEISIKMSKTESEDEFIENFGENFASDQRSDDDIDPEGPGK